MKTLLISSKKRTSKLCMFPALTRLFFYTEKKFFPVHGGMLTHTQPQTRPELSSTSKQKMLPNKSGVAPIGNPAPCLLGSLLYTLEEHQPHKRQSTVFAE